MCETLLHDKSYEKLLFTTAVEIDYNHYLFIFLYYPSSFSTLNWYFLLFSSIYYFHQRFFFSKGVVGVFCTYFIAPDFWHALSNNFRLLYFLLLCIFSLQTGFLNWIWFSALLSYSAAYFKCHTQFTGTKSQNIPRDKHHTAWTPILRQRFWI